MPLEKACQPHPVAQEAGSRRSALKLRAPVLVHGLGRVLDPDFSGGPELTLYGGERISAGPNRLFAVDGAAIIGTNVLTKLHGGGLIGEMAATSTFDEIASWWGKHARNPSVLFIIDERESRGLVLQDPLGGALVYRFVSEGNTFYSSDIESLQIILREAGYTLQKSRQFQVERVLLGNGGLTPTSYESVDTLEPFQYAELGPDGIKHCELLSPSLEGASYPELVGLLRQEVIDSIVAIASAPTDQRVAHLTGGFDSRLVLGAIMEAGLSEKFEFFCSGPTGTTDRKVADGLTAAYALRRTRTGGLTPAKTNNLTERLLAPMFNSGGITGSGPTGREEPVDVLSIGGGYGEVLRTFYGERVASYDSKQIDSDQLLARIAPNAVKGNSLFVRARVEELRSALHSRWRRLCDMFPERTDFVGDALYTYTRNRYHIGQNSMLWSRIGSRFDPLYSYHGYLAAQYITQPARTANVIGYDLITSFDPRLSRYPFDRPRFDSKEFFQSRRAPAEIPLPSWTKEIYVEGPAPKSNQNPVIPDSMLEMIIPDLVASGDERRSYITAANRIGVNYWQVASLSGAQSALRKLVQQGSFTDLADTLDIGYLNRLTENSLNKRQEIRDVYGLIGLLGWLAE